MKTVKLTDKELDLLHEVLDYSIDDAHNCMSDMEDDELNEEINDHVVDER